MGIIKFVKTQIIQLEPHDDTLSVRDKMDWSQTPRVLLVWPEKGKVLRSRLDLILLERYSSAHGSQLALLTSDREVIKQASEAGIPVFQSRSEAQLQPWGKSFREFRRRELETYAAETLPFSSIEREAPQPRKKLPPWVRITLFTLGVLSVLSLAAFLLPSAEVVVLPQENQVSLSVPVQAQPGRTQITLSGLIPARELEIIVEDQLSTPSTGDVSIPADYARGEAVFTNLGVEEILIPKGTILSTDGDPALLYKTLSAGTTPPEQGGQIILEVEAYLPGSTGNIPANQITKINLEAGADLTVTNPAPVEGGTDIQIPAPTLSDRLSLVGEMSRVLEDKALEEIKRQLGEEDVLLSPRLISLEVVEEEFTPRDDDPGEILWLDKTVHYQVYYAAADDLYQLASDLVQAQYQQRTIVPDLESIQLEHTTSPQNLGSGNYQWEVAVSWIDRQTFSPEQISDWIAGKSTSEAEKILHNQLDLKETPLITIKPNWWPRIPVLPFRIMVNQGRS